MALIPETGTLRLRSCTSFIWRRVGLAIPPTEHGFESAESLQTLAEGLAEYWLPTRI